MADPPERRRESDVDLAELLDSLPVLINVISHDQRYAYVNRPFELLHSVDRAGIVGRELTEMLGDAYEELRPRIEQALAGERVRFEVDLEAPDGQINTFRTTYVPRRREDGRVDGFVSHSQNVTARKRAEREKRRLEERLSTLQRLEGLATLAGGVAHDFNNLLVAVLANAQLVRAALGDDHPSADDVAQIEAAARQAADLSRQMLAYAGRGRLEREAVDLSALGREMADLLRAAMGPGVRLQLDLAQGLPPVEGDRSQLAQILVNLLTNASEAVGDSGCVCLRTGVESRTADELASTYVDDGLDAGRYVWLEVEDDGVGMEPDTLARLFDPFYSTKFPGRGLGLAACFGIVRAHRGAISVESAPGEGARLRVWLPASADRAIAAPSRAASERAPTGGGGGRVLVVDDDARIRRLAARILEAAGFEVAVAEDGRAALDRLQADGDAPDAILLDLTMPVMSGVETLRRLRSSGCEAPVVICSGYGESHVQTCLRDLEVQGIVEKPFDADELVAAMHRVTASERGDG